MLADVIVEEHNRTRLPVVILGKCFKKETNLTVGSPSILLNNLLKERREMQWVQRVEQMTEPHRGVERV